MKLVIERSKWLHGEGHSNSSLLRKRDGKMCCLGFYSLSCGLTQENIMEVPGPRDYTVIKYFNKDETRWLLDHNDANSLMDLNDGDPILMDADSREQAIINIFARHDVEVEFID